MDPYAAEALKSFDRERYDTLKGWTKRPGSVSALYESLAAFGTKDVQFGELDDKLQECFNSAFYIARKAFQLGTKCHKNPKTAVIQALDQPTSAGINFIGKKNENLEEIYDYGCYLQHQAKRFGYKTQCPVSLATTRGGLVDLSIKQPKTRLAWVIPAEVLFCEGAFGQSLTDAYCQDHTTAYFGGKNLMLRLKNRLNTSFPGIFVGLDWSGFDASVPSFIIRMAFDILWSNVNFDVSRRGKIYSKKRKQKFAKLREFIVYNFINTAVKMPDGRVFRKNHGVPSGSWFTSIIDSICNYIVIQALTQYVDMPISRLMTMGDDSDFLVDELLDESAIIQKLAKLSRVAAKQLGMTLHPEKQKIQRTIKERSFIGYQFRGAKLYRPTDEWFRMMLYPESKVDSIDVSWSRMLGYVVVGALNDLQAFRFIQYYQTCYDVRKANPHELRENRFFNKVFDTDIDYGGSSVFHFTQAIFRKRLSAYAITASSH
jgi:hypothetical protein